MLDRELLYQGHLSVLEGSAGQWLCQDLVALLHSERGPEWRRHEGCQFLDSLEVVRGRLGGAAWRERTRQYLLELGLAPEDFAIDRLRLRGVTPDAHRIPAAAPAFFAHRDTWYANPQAQINLWMPLHDVDDSNSFVFYPGHFQAPVENDSGRFDYDEFKRLAGFQNSRRDAGAVYPRWLTPDDSPHQPVVLGRGCVLAFSGAHLHRTLPNRGELIRFSVDLRIVHRGDHERGRGAPNVDNRSRGDALCDYVG